MKFLNKIKRNILLRKEIRSISFCNTRMELSTINKNKDVFNLIKKHYEQYIKDISTPEMAISLHLAYFIMDYCIEFKPKRVIDLGSGFSSLIFQMYQNYFKEENIIVFSIDDDKDWLDKTKTFVREKGLSEDHIIDISALEKLNLNNYFELVLLDLNFVEIRKKYLQFSVDLLSKNGLLIMDDVHKIEFLREVKKVADANSLKFIDIKKLTVDTMGRFAIGLQK